MSIRSNFIRSAITALALAATRVVALDGAAAASQTCGHDSLKRHSVVPGERWHRAGSAETAAAQPILLAQSSSIIVLPDASATSVKEKPVAEEVSQAVETGTAPATAPSLEPARPLTAEDRNVRIVGPRFLPDQREAADPRVPDRTTVP